MCRQMKDGFQHVEELTEGIARQLNPTVMGILEDQTSLGQFLLQYQRVTSPVRANVDKTFPFLPLPVAVLVCDCPQGWDASHSPKRHF